MHRHNVIVLCQRPAPHSPQLLHMPTHTQQQTQMHTQRSNVRARLAIDGKDGEMAVVVKLDQLCFINRSDAQLPLDGRDQRRSLEEGARERFQRALEVSLGADLVVQAQDANVLLAGALLRFDEASGSVDADGQAAGDFGVERAGVACLFAAQDATDPGDNFV